MRRLFSYLLFSPAPGAGKEQDQHGIEFESAGEHVEDQDELGEGIEKGIIGHGADSVEAGADIVHGGGDGGEAGFKRGAVCADEDQGNGENDDIGA